MKEKEIKISALVTEPQKKKIESICKRCGLTKAEYLRQRALGYEPRVVVPDVFFVLCEKLDALTEAPFTAEVNQTAIDILKAMEKEFLLPRKEDMKKWQPPDSGPSKDD